MLWVTTSTCNVSEIFLEKINKAYRWPEKEMQKET